MRNYYPVVYVRGYAMRSSEVENTFNLPYYGFNLGSTQYRQAAQHDPEMHIFESPVIRLLKDHRYVDAYGAYCDRIGNPIPASVPDDDGDDAWRRTLWVFRYYDLESAMYGEARPTFPDYAAHLLAFLNRVREACRSPEGFKVNLVAHSMGGLIARCYLQGSETDEFKSAVNRVKKREPARYLAQPVEVHKLFTFATPHRGIRFRGAMGPVNWIRDVTGGIREDQFTPRFMARYLGPGATKNRPHGYKPRPHAPPLERTFSLVGTNADDYTVRSARVSVGPKSDGLVLIESGYIRAGARAYVHRSHSGPFGIVNSEEGYQNLQRFLFGNRRFQIRLRFGAVRRHLPDTDDDTTLQFLLLDTAIALRGVAGYLDRRNEQTLSAEPIEVKKHANKLYKPKGERDPVLFTGYLFADAQQEPENTDYRAVAHDPHARWVLDLQIKPKYERVQRVIFWTTSSHFEGDYLLNDRVEFALADTGTEPPFTYRWRGDAGEEMNTPRTEEATETVQRYAIALPQAAERYFKDVDLLVEVGPWS